LVTGLWLASLTFFAVNVWILGIMITDVGSLKTTPRGSNDEMSANTEFGEDALASGAALVFTT